MARNTPRKSLLLGGMVLLGLTALVLFLPGLVKGEDTPLEPRGRDPEPVQAAPLDGLSPPTRHTVTLHPAGPEDPNAPAETYADPAPAPGGDVANHHPIPDHLKGTPYRLSFVTGDYTPPDGERIDPLLIEGLGRLARPHTYGYVMFEGAIQTRKVRALEDLGLTFGTPHTFNCLQAWIPAKALPGLRVHPLVRWVGYARPEQKVDAFILEELMKPGTDPTEEFPVFVNVFDSDLGPWSAPRPIFSTPPAVPNDRKLVALAPRVMISNGPLQRTLEEARGRVMGYEDSIRTFYVWATRNAIRRIMKLDVVAGLDMAFPPDPLHDRSLRMIGADYMATMSGRSGKNTTVAVVDSGLYHGHHDISQTYAIGWDYTGEGDAYRDQCEHGTHVAGTLLGDGTARPDRRYRGTAPGTGTVAEHPVYVVKVFNGGCQATLNHTLFVNQVIAGWTNTTRGHKAYGTTTKKATVVNNSFSSGWVLSTGYYGTDSLSRAVDNNTLTHRQLYVVSAGNDGGSSTKQVYRSCRNPASAKSAFTVGNVMDYDESSTTPPLGGRYPGAMNHSSSKGPTRDGRMKPNISAPGTWIVSARAQTTLDYRAKWGTSMSAPHVSGVAAMMQDFSSLLRDHPCACRAMMMATSMPYMGMRLWSPTTAESYLNRRGMGMVNAIAARYQRNFPNGWACEYATSELTNKWGGFSFNSLVPVDATRAVFVMTWDEKAPALNATQAVLYDLDLIIDAEPYNGGVNGGDFFSRSKIDNVEFYDAVNSISKLRGKRILVKVPYLKRATSTTEVVRIGVGIFYQRGYTLALPSVTVAATPAKVKPSERFTATATTAVTTGRANHVYVDLTAPAFVPRLLKHTTADGRSLDTEWITTNTQDSRFNWTLGEVGFWSQAAHRRLTWEMAAPPTNGVYEIKAHARESALGTAVGKTTVCVDGLAPNQPPNLKSPTHTPNVWTQNRNFTATWSHASDNGCAGVKGCGVRLGTDCKTPTSANHGNLTSYSTLLPNTGGRPIYFSIAVWDQVGNVSKNSCLGPFLFDMDPPPAPGSVKSTTHSPRVWSNRSQITFTWTPPSPGSGSPIAGYSVLVSRNPTETPAARINLEPKNTYTTRLSTSASGYYFHIRAMDKVGHWGPAAHAGPFLIDTVAPTGGRIAIAGGAPVTRSLVVTLNGLGALEAQSGLAQMRFSANGSTWSPWEVYAASRTGWNLAAYGGNAQPGEKRVYVQYRDRALNVSAAVLDAIRFEPIGIASVAPNRGTLIGGDTVTITGAGFKSGSTKVFFRGLPATALNVQSTTKLTCKTPRYLRWEKVDVELTVGPYGDRLAGGYEYVGANVLATGNPRLATPFGLVFNAPVDGGRAYVAAASFGDGPLPMPPHNALPLTPDVLFFLTANGILPAYFQGFAGSLGATGQGKGVINLPDLPPLVGLTVHVAFLTIDPSKPLAIRTVSQGKALKIMPK